MVAKTNISNDSISVPISLSAKQTDQLLLLQKDVLHAVATTRDHQLILDQLCRTAEAMLPNSVASVMIYNDDQCGLTVKSAPSIPKIAVDQLNGLIPGKAAGSCGTAVFHNEPQFVCNTFTDKRWANLTQFAHDFNICACWSMPIRTERHESMGSFALSSFEHREPLLFHKTLLETAASLASIILKRQKEENALQYAAHHDALTDLPNRILFNLRLEHAIARSKRNNTELALLFVDLDHFKHINDTQGHDTGDKALKIAADVIRACIRAEDTLARLGGDEFVLLLEEISDSFDIQHVADKIINAFSHPVSIDGKPYPLTASMGISLYPMDGLTPQTLLKNADTAMYKAKSQGRNSYVFYEPALTLLIQKRVQLETELRRALQKKQFLVYYQPIFDTKTTQLVAAEALVRWSHPEKGLIPPNDFIPLAEETGLINELGHTVLETACKQCLAWWQSGLPKFTLAVNLSTKQLKVECTENIIALLDSLNFPAKQLELEITETLIMEHPNMAIAELSTLRNAGISIALDDFGTGQSSLAKLKHLPINKLKIDRSFIHDIPDDPDDIIIAKTIIGMGKSLGLTVVAEGVETKAQYDILFKESCDLLQGFFFARPLPAREFENLLKQTQ